jgi:hypothetical protein
MTDLLPQAPSLPSGLSADQVNDAFYFAHRGAQALGRHGHGPRVVNTRWDLDDPHGRVVIRCIFVVKESDYRLRYAPPAGGVRRLRFSTFDEDRARLEQLVRDAFEARAVRFDTLYVGIALGNL